MSLLELKFVSLVLFSTESIVCSRPAMSSASKDILSCCKYFTPNSNISLLDLLCLEVKNCKFRVAFASRKKFFQL